MKLLFLLTVIAVEVIAMVESFGCPAKVEVLFRADREALKQTAPDLYEGIKDRGRRTDGYLSATICPDGRTHDGFYCASGGCNVFGNNCDGYCYKGLEWLNSVQMFKRNYGDVVEDIYCLENCNA